AMSPSGHADDEVFVQQDNTPIASHPGVGGKILIRVDSGFILTVLGRDGDWLEVTSPVLKLPGDSLWVPADRVGSDAPGGAGALDGSVVADGPVYRLEVTGSQELRMRARCRIDDGTEDNRSDDAFRQIIEAVPAVVEIEGPVDCFVRMFGPPGELSVVLRRVDGTVVASGTIYESGDAVHVRSDGPWGSAAGVIESSVFVSFDGPSGNIVPPIANPVPPLANPVPPLVAVFPPQ
ncbi:MAG: hypothetical protein ACREEV_07245, partial [Dongiaceae bacterium]